MFVFILIIFAGVVGGIIAFVVMKRQRAELEDYKKEKLSE